MIDSGCECSKLILAAAASPDPNWGSRKAKLDDINIQLLTSEEKTWYNMLVATLTSDGETYRSSISTGLEANPDSPLVNWFSTGGDLKKHQEFAEKFPDVASGAYNFLAYGYARGDVDGEVDFNEAYKAAHMAQSLHAGPNSLDSKAEIAVIKGDYEVALSNQLKAYDHATFASPYEPKLVTYYRNTVKDEISKNLKEAQRAVQKAILDRNYEEFEKYIGCARLITNLNSLFVTFAKYKHKSKVNPLLWDKMAEIGKSKGADPTEWYATFSPMLSLIHISEPTRPY